MNAWTVPVRWRARPSARGCSSSSTRSQMSSHELDERADRLAIDLSTRRRRRRAGPRLQPGRRRCGSPSCTAGARPRRRRTGTAAAPARRTRRSSSSRCARRSCGWRRQGRHWRRPCGAARTPRPSRTAWARGPGDGSGHGRLSLRRMFSWSRNSRSSPFTLKISALVLIASGPSDVGVEQREEQERCVRGLRRNAGDAGDVDVGASGAVDELEVGEQRLVAVIDADGELAAPSGRSRGPGHGPCPRRDGPRRRAAAERTSRAPPGW